MTDAVEALKREAKKISRATTITHQQAQDVLAVQQGFTHWGALLKGLEAKASGSGSLAGPEADAAVIPEYGMKRLLRPLTDTSHTATRLNIATMLHDIGEPRLLLIAGGTSTGKTSMMRIILEEFRHDLKVRSIGDEIVSPRDHKPWIPKTMPDVKSFPIDPEFRMNANSMRSRIEGLAAEATKDDADVILFDEVGNHNAAVILHLVETNAAKLIISTIHETNPSRAIAMFLDRAGARVEPGGIALIQMGRNQHGERVIESIIGCRTRD
jgi:type IV secretory pathway ATPase VirB11/archaellum biosynthesis ATPase